MKRRTIDSAKSRRSNGNKKTKISDGIYNSAFLYTKFLLIWAVVMTADFLVDFRFEYLWPLWLIFCCAVDSFRYQGMLFCVMFCGMSIVSDMICYLLIPTQWLYLAASTYVWVQYVWYTERGLCLPTVSLWILFIYIETSLRLKDLRCAPFQIDLCRPFAAHCIGYPVVTLGFGCKSYVSYRFRMRRQREVEKENTICFELLQQALPAHLIKNFKLEERNYMEVNSEGAKLQTTAQHFNNQTNNFSREDCVESMNIVNFNDNNINTCNQDLNKMQNKCQLLNNKNQDLNNISHEHNNKKPELINKNQDVNIKNQDINLNYQEMNSKNVKTEVNLRADNRLANIYDFNEDQLSSQVTKVSSFTSLKKIKNNLMQDPIVRMEQEVKRGKMDVWNARKMEQELRLQITQLIASQNNIIKETEQLIHDNNALQIKLSNLVTSRQQEKQNLSVLERKLQEEKKLKSNTEQQLQHEKKRNQDLSKQLPKFECNESCKEHQINLEKEIIEIGEDMKRCDEQMQRLEHQANVLRKLDEVGGNNEALVSRLRWMDERTIILENNLSAQTRLKMDLFSALGDAKRQIEIQNNMLMDRDIELKEVESKIAELMALIPSTNFHTNQKPHFSQTFTNQHYKRDSQSSADLTNDCILSTDKIRDGVSPTDITNNFQLIADDLQRSPSSNLNPKASYYLPKTNPL